MRSLRRQNDRQAAHHELPRTPAQHGAATRGTRAGRNRLTPLARLRAEVSRNPWRGRAGHWAVRRVADSARRGLGLLPDTLFVIVRTTHCFSPQRLAPKTQ